MPPHAATAVPADLPQDIWKLILQHVPLSDRLGSCSLVSQKLRAAAAAATTELCVGLDASQDRSASCMQYIQHYGSYLTSLHLSCWGGVLQQLPCPQLLELQLIACTLGLGEGAGAALGLGEGAGAVCVFEGCAASLTRLVMQGCKSDSISTGSLVGLSVLGKLQHLCIDVLYTSAAHADFGVVHGTFPFTILHSMTQLTHLALHSVLVEGLQHVSCLTRLCTLEIVPSHYVNEVMEHGTLPTSLRHVRLGGIEDGILLRVDELSRHTQLTALCLEKVWLFDTRLPGVTRDAVLLSAVAKMQQLHTLTLDADRPEKIEPPLNTAFTSLVASSMLKDLAVTRFDLPPDVWLHVLAPTNRLTGLTSLRTWEWDEDGASSALVAQPVSPWSDTTLSRLVTCCPALEQLSLAVLSDTSLSCITSFSSLTDLTLLYQPAPDPDGPSQLHVWPHCLAQVSSLQRLRLDLSHLDLSTWEVVVPLTALRALTDLSVLAAYRTLELAHHEGAPDEPPSVWRQLLRACLSEFDGTPTLKLQLAEGVEELKQLTKQQQERIGQQDDEIAGLRQEMAQQGAQLQAMQAQLQQLLKQHQQQ